MTGWRVGYAAGNKQIIKAMTDVASHSTSNPVTFAQYGGVEALNGPETELNMMKSEFEKEEILLLNKFVILLNLNLLYQRVRFIFS